ncbi:hypothetical protein ACFWQ6_00790 [Streptomyces coelicoflavus]|uniref:hypothetical protein n=1 Tax=Streptomyces coelicoflavus TaxID=285562 RepID=UPI0036541530
MALTCGDVGMSEYAVAKSIFLPGARLTPPHPQLNIPPEPAAQGGGRFNAVSASPSGLGDRGRRLWEETLAPGSLTPSHLVLLEEACRAADRLELLDSILRLATSSVNPDFKIFHEISGVLAEARQQQGVLKALLAAIGKAPGVSGQVKDSSAGGAGVSDLTARIAERRREAEG